MKKIFSAILGIFTLLILGASVFAQTSEDIAAKYGVTFPISELSGCVDYSACRTYCEDPINQNACVDFAKKKGFYNEDSVKIDIRNNAFWARTKAALGCDSESSCRVLCEQAANFDKCSSFAKSQGLAGGHTDDPTDAQILEKAKQILGCTSYESCISFCSQEANRDKCSQFAKEAGLRGGEQSVGPGGCNSEESCKKFCSASENYKICEGFSSAHGGNFQGPGGCDSEESCRAYCTQNPGQCGGFDNQGYESSEVCNRTPNCAWSNNTCTCTSFSEVDPKEYCAKYPDQCQGFYQDSSAECAKYPGCSFTNNRCECSGPESSYDPSKECANYPGCSWTGTTCQCTSHEGSSESSGSSPTPYQGSYDAATECSKYPGCSWNGSYCQCSTDSKSGTSQSTYDYSAECTKTAGCSWNGTSCQCSNTQTSSTPAPTTQQTTEQTTQQSGGGGLDQQASQCSQYPGCSWTGSTCECTGVQGTQTKRNILEIIWDFFFRR